MASTCSHRCRPNGRSSSPIFTVPATAVLGSVEAAGRLCREGRGPLRPCHRSRRDVRLSAQFPSRWVSCAPGSRPGGAVFELGQDRAAGMGPDPPPRTGRVRASKNGADRSPNVRSQVTRAARLLKVLCCGIGFWHVPVAKPERPPTGCNTSHPMMIWPSDRTPLPASGTIYSMDKRKTRARPLRRSSVSRELS